MCGRPPLNFPRPGSPVIPYFCQPYRRIQIKTGAAFRKAWAWFLSNRNTSLWFLRSCVSKEANKHVQGFAAALVPSTKACYGKCVISWVPLLGGHLFESTVGRFIVRMGFFFFLLLFLVLILAEFCLSLFLTQRQHSTGLGCWRESTGLRLSWPTLRSV